MNNVAVQDIWMLLKVFEHFLIADKDKIQLTCSSRTPLYKSKTTRINLLISLLQVAFPCFSKTRMFYVLLHFP